MANYAFHVDVNRTVYSYMASIDSICQQRWNYVGYVVWSWLYFRVDPEREREMRPRRFLV